MSKVLDILDCQGTRVGEYTLPDAVIELEKGEHTGKQTDAALAHRGLVQAVCKRHGK